jgi:hypothetical protein
MAIILATWETEIRRSKVQGQPVQIDREITGGVTQATDCLLCNQEALSSNPSPTKQTHKHDRIVKLVTIFREKKT